jgi:hypothetical protein
VDSEVDKDGDSGFQKAKRGMKVVYDHSDSESSNNERRKMLLGHHLSTHRQSPTPGGGGSRACPKGGGAPQVDGDANQL